ncbi:SDR family oxidoreductase [Pseudoalteromonas sp. J010]|uniref:SDR family oxidoreductase n=1 Tax=Pseudoalteromonas sp. J010 TaxID=998465 RepID=UPI000F646EFA|nr:SDR family oxidoreductase [Pseudoalteromonas sp. J010]RRS06810.1 SDR family oxidoreductase [Pseudoalteromonas sp. J010]
MTNQFEGKVALITGAARNMGRAFAESLAKAGCDIVIHYNSDASASDAETTAALVEQAGQRALLVQGELSQPSNVQNLFSQAKEAFGRIDIVINNAGKVIKRPFTEYTENDFDQLFNVNTKAAFFVMQEAAKHIEDNGRIINMGTSLLGAFTGYYSLYAGSKAPLEDFTRALAKEIGSRGVTVNTVCPGPIDTEFFHGEENEQSVAYLSAASVANRLGKIEDIVPFIKFIASEDAQWTTGQTLFINGGFVTR